MYSKRDMLRDQKKSLKEILKSEINMRGNSRAKQRTEEWYKTRIRTIGGSELSAILGENKFKSRADVIMDKCGLSVVNSIDPDKNRACWWGIMFESVAKRAIELNLKTKISGDDISISVNRYHSNSPDGFFIIGLNKNLEITMKKKEIRCYAICLLEIKCPLMRFPKAEIEIPPYYIPQVKSGLIAAPFSLFAVFADVYFKKCSLSNLNFSKLRDFEYHKEKVSFPFPPFAIGIIGIVVKSADKKIRDELRNEYFHSSIDSEEENSLIDFGDASTTLFDKMLYLHSNKNLIQIILDPIFNEDNKKNRDNLLLEFEKKIKDDILPVGIIPYKLFELRYLYIPRDSTFISKIYPLLEQTMKAVEEIRSSAEPSKRSLEVIKTL